MLDSSGYLLFYTTDATQPDREWVVEGIVGQQTTTTVHGLSPRTNYYFKVQARNSVGNGPLCPTVIFRTAAREYATTQLVVCLFGIKTKFYYAILLANQLASWFASWSTTC